MGHRACSYSTSARARITSGVFVHSYGRRRSMRLQHRSGDVLQPAAEELPEPPALAHPHDLRAALVFWIERPTTARGARTASD